MLRRVVVLVMLSVVVAGLGAVARAEHRDFGGVGVTRVTSSR